MNPAVCMPLITQQRSLKVHCDLIIEIDLPEPWWFNGLFFLVPMDSIRAPVQLCHSTGSWEAARRPLFRLLGLNKAPAQSEEVNELQALFPKVRGTFL